MEEKVYRLLPIEITCKVRLIALLIVLHMGEETLDGIMFPLINNIVIDNSISCSMIHVQI